MAWSLLVFQRHPATLYPLSLGVLSLAPLGGCCGSDSGLLVVAVVLS